MIDLHNYYRGDYFFPAGKYDQIYDEELGENNMLKLPFNNGDNAIEAASKFCIREGRCERTLIDTIK